MTCRGAVCLYLPRTSYMGSRTCLGLHQHSRAIPQCMMPTGLAREWYTQRQMISEAFAQQAMPPQRS